MAYALVGTNGAAVTGSTGSISPAWGTGQNRTAGNLLIAWLAVYTATAPSPPSGWSLAAFSQGIGLSASVFYRIATGSDAAPTLTSAPTTLIGQLAEFSGGTTSGLPVDQSAATGTSLGSTTASWVVTCPHADTAAGELVLTAIVAAFGQAQSRNLVDSVNNGVTLTSINNNAASLSTRYAFGYGVTTSNAAATSDSASISNMAGGQGETSLLATFFLAGAPPHLAATAQATAKATALITAGGTLAYVGHAEAAAATVNLPSGWRVGDLAVAYAYRSGSTAAPTVPSGWTQINAATGANANSRAIGWRVLQAGDTSTGTWTNATATAVTVLRNPAASPIGASAAGGSNNATLTQPALTLSVTNGTSWLLLFVGSKASNANTVTYPGAYDEGSSQGALNSALEPNVTTFAGGAYSATVDTTQNRTDVIEILAGAVVTPPAALPVPLLGIRTPRRPRVVVPSRGQF